MQLHQDDGPVLQVDDMPHQRLIHDHDEDWAGKRDRKERKRLQNRLNQRASRERKCRRSAVVRGGGEPDTPMTPAQVAEARAEAMRAALRRFSQQALASYRAGHPRADHLLGLIHLNFVNGLSMNASVLRLDVNWLNCKSVSPIGFIGPKGSPVSAAAARPPSLAPTALQLQTPHHPWVDLFPFPQMRDNLLVASSYMSEESEIQLWDDIIESKSPGSDWSGLVLWGNAWDPDSWEVTDQFVRRWGWLLRGCPQLLVSTNRWRRTRGERGLTYDGTVHPVGEPW